MPYRLKVMLVNVVVSIVIGILFYCCLNLIGLYIGYAIWYVNFMSSVGFIIPTCAALIALYFFYDNDVNFIKNIKPNYYSYSKCIMPCAVYVSNDVNLAKCSFVPFRQIRTNSFMIDPNEEEL